MAPAVTTLWRSVDAGDIDTALPDLWRDSARETPVSRALMSNLVVVRPGAPATGDGIVDLDAQSDIVRLAERHPARVILLNYSPTPGRRCAPGKATVGVLTFSAGSARYGVEVIEIDAECSEASVPSIVRRLTRGDVPTTVWWTGDLSRMRPPDSIVETGRQLLYDSAAWSDVRGGARTVVATLALPRAPDLADLNWHRLAPMRSAIVHGLRSEARAMSSLRAVTIRYRPGEAAAAWLMDAWLRRGLRRSDPGTVEEARGNDDVVTVTLAGEDWVLTATIDSQRVEVACGHGPPFSVPVPRQTVADAVAAELRSLGHDMYLRETMLTLAA